MIIGFVETDHWPKIFQTEIYEHGQQFYESQIQLPDSQNNIFTTTRLGFLGVGGMYGGYIQGL